MVWVVDRSHSHSPSLWLPWKTSGPCSHQSISGSHSIWVTSCVLKIGVRIWTPLSSWLMYLSWPSRLMASFFDPRICCWVTHVDSKVNWIVAWPHDTKDWMKQLQILGKVKRAPKMHTMINICYISLDLSAMGHEGKFSCWNRRAFAVNLLMKWLPNAVATKELLNSTDEKSLVGQKPMGSQDTLTAAQTTRALWSRRFLPFSRSRDSCRYLKFEVICLSINLNFHWFTLFGNQQIFRCSPGPVPRFPNPPRSQVSRHGCEGQLSQFWASSARAFAKQKKAVFRFF